MTTVAVTPVSLIQRWN